MDCMRTRKGGGFTLKGAEVNASLIKDIIDLFKFPEKIGTGTSGTAFLTSAALPGMCNPTTECDAKFIAKIIPILGYIEPKMVESFNEECAIQRDIYVKLLSKFNYSFVPMVIYSKIYEQREFREQFPSIDVEDLQIEDPDEVTKFGVIIMESFGDVRPLKKTDTEYFPIALREMSMLAQVGYKDDSRSMDNFLIQQSHHVYMIDFGTAEKIAPVDDADISVLSTLYKNDKYAEDDDSSDQFMKSDNVINLTETLAPVDAVIGPSRMTDEMRDSSIKLMEDLASLSLSGGHKKSRRRRAKRKSKRRSKPVSNHVIFESSILG